METPILDNLTAETPDISSKIRKLRFVECKLLKASNTAKAAIMLSPEIIDISAPDSDNGANTVGISVIGGTGTVGTVIRGPLGLTAMPSKVRIGAMWRLNDVLLSGAPSTIMTPIPVLRFSLPLENVASLVQTITTIAAVSAGG